VIQAAIATVALLIIVYYDGLPFGYRMILMNQAKKLQNEFVELKTFSSKEELRKI
jgi:hypothetical protein